jgi:hypothetical protein
MYINMSPLKSNKNTHTFLQLVFVLFIALSFVTSILTSAQTNPTNPGGGTTATPNLTPTNGSQTTNTSTPGGITPVTPITPDINNEQIIEGTGTTTVETKKAPSSVIPVAPIVGEQTSIKPSFTSVNTTETVRTGGLEIGLGLIAIIALVIGYYYYKKKGDRKSVLKTSEKKLRF